MKDVSIHARLATGDRDNLVNYRKHCKTVVKDQNLPRPSQQFHVLFRFAEDL